MTKRNEAKTIAGRKALYLELGRNFNAWMKMTDDVLLIEVQKTCPAIVDGTREEFFKYLVMSHVERMVGGI